MIFCSTIFLINSAHAENFKTMLRDGGITFQIDLDSIKKQGQYHHVVVAQKYNSMRKAQHGKYNESRADFILDCSTSREYTARIQHYLNGKFLWAASNPEKFNLVKDQSGMIEHICNNEIKQ